MRLRRSSSTTAPEIRLRSGFYGHVSRKTARRRLPPSRWPGITRVWERLQALIISGIKVRFASGRFLDGLRRNLPLIRPPLVLAPQVLRGQRREHRVNVASRPPSGGGGHEYRCSRGPGAYSDAHRDNPRHFTNVDLGDGDLRGIGTWTSADAVDFKPRRLGLSTREAHVEILGCLTDSGASNAPNRTTEPGDGCRRRCALWRIRIHVQATAGGAGVNVAQSSPWI